MLFGLKDITQLNLEALIIYNWGQEKKTVEMLVITGLVL